MGRERDEDEPEAPEAPAGDSAGTYYLSIEEFESRLPRHDPEDEPTEEP